MILDVTLDPSVGAEKAGKRPCLVVTNDIINARVPVIQVVPITVSNEKKERIVTNVVLTPDSSNNLDKRSIADCLQTRPIDHMVRKANYRGVLDPITMEKVDNALRRVFEL
jgi:mRNA interferase MazF